MAEITGFRDGLENMKVEKSLSIDEVRDKLACLAREDDIEIRIKYDNEWTQYGKLIATDDHLRAGVIVLVGKELSKERIRSATDTAFWGHTAMPLHAPDEWYVAFSLPILIDRIQLIEELERVGCRQ